MIKIDTMDEKAKRIVEECIEMEYENSDEILPDFDIYISWKSKVLQNYKYMLATSLMDGKYYELTFNGDKNVWYVDIYVKQCNILFPSD